jgi:hypothetical protein
MSPSKIVLHSSLLPEGTPVVADLLDAQLNRAWRGVLAVGRPSSLSGSPSLTAGRYTLDVTLPSGQTAAFPLDIGAKSDARLDLHLPSKKLPPLLGALKTGADLGASVVLPSIVPPTAGLASCWVRLWSHSGSRWRTLPLPPPQPIDQSAARRFNLGELPESAHYFQTGGPIQPMVTALPPGGISVVVAPSGNFDLDNPTKSNVDVSVIVGSVEAQALTAYLAHGDVERARIVGSLVDRLAEPELDPATAVLGGYFLLANHELKRLGDLFARSLWKWQGWLTDITIIDAWRALRTSPPDVEQARIRFLAAADRGAPLFSRGLRLLLDGLNMLAADTIAGGGEIDRALASASRFGKVADWRALFTSYLAVHPAHPLHQRASIRTVTAAYEAAQDRNAAFPWASGQANHFSDLFSRAFVPSPEYHDADQAREVASAAYRALRRTVGP